MNHARHKIESLIKKYKALTETDKKILTEANVVHQFLTPLLDSLGWPVGDPHRFKYELSTQVGRPDVTLLPEKGGNIFVEAKRFGVIQELVQSRKSISGIVTPQQLALPGIATDRTAEEQQAINYAFSNGGTWAILSNFERLRLFNARRDWLVLSFENPSAYLDEFDLLWQLSYENIVEGRLDALSNQRHREDVDTNYLNFINEWRERLAQDILNRPHDNWWVYGDDGQIKLAELRGVVQRVLDRLVVIRFAEDHLVIPAGTLHSLYELCRTNPYTFTLSQFFRQLFRRFDEDHNSALFAADVADHAVFSDEVLAGLVQKLYEARYRALSADIMGNTYEQYLGKALVLSGTTIRTADNLETRKKQGSYYTPQVIVRYLVDNSLGRYLYGTANGQPDGEPLPGETRKTAADIRSLRVIDPACGSGGFLIYAYELLANFYRGEITRLEQVRQARLDELIAQGKTKPIELRMELADYTSQIDALQNYPHLILENHLYGVDLDPQAAEIATVNLILRAMADQPRTQKQLPLILNQNVKVGNALIGAGPTDERLADHAADLAELRRLRQTLAAESNNREHRATLDAIDAIRGRVNGALDAGLAGHFSDLETVRPFNWAVEFPELFVDEQGARLGEQAGFDVVVGNPPWEILKPDLREYYAQFDAEIESKLTRQKAEARIEQLNALDPTLAEGWQRQVARIEAAAAYLRQSPDFVSQGRGDMATHKLFLERGYKLLEKSGRLAFVIPSGIYRDLGTKELREMLLNEGRIEYLFSFSNERFFFPNVHHSFQFTLLGTQRGEQNDGFWTTFRFNPRVAVSPDELPTFLNNPANLIHVKRNSIIRFSPDSLSLMEFQSQQDADVASKVYENNPLIGEEVTGRWMIQLNREFDMTNDRALFNQIGDGYPLYEGKMIHQFDSYYSKPSFWVQKEKADQHFRNKKSDSAPLDYTLPRLGFREIARPTDSRTLIATVLPPETCCNHKISVVAPHLSTIQFDEMLFCSSVLNSLVMDFVVRFKISTGVSMFHFYQLPLPRLTKGDPFFDAIVPRAARLTCTTPAFAALWQAVMGSAWDVSLAATIPAARQTLRDELDALIAHLYGLSRDDFAHILSTFPLVFPPDATGQAKKAALLATFDALTPSP